MKGVEKKISLMDFTIALALIITGVIIKDSAGLFFIFTGLLYSLYQILFYFGVIDLSITEITEKILGDQDSFDPVSKMGAIAYLLALSFILIYYNLRITLDQVIFLGIFVTLLVRKTGKFLSDWTPFALLIFAYDAMRGIADDLGSTVCYQGLISAEKALFLGHLPTRWLQENFFHPGIINGYDVLAVNLYFLHFTPAVLFAVFLWMKDRNLFIKFRDCMILVSYAALITFLLFPSAPPWLAQEKGYISGIDRILSEINQENAFIPKGLPSIYILVNSNPVAAIPSLHAAYPSILFLFAVRWSRKALPLILLPLSVGLSSVYLGEHYIIDILIGFIYAILAYLIIEKLHKNSTQS